MKRFLLTFACLLLLLPACVPPALSNAERLYLLQRIENDWYLASLDAAGQPQPLLADVDAFAVGPRYAVVTADEQQLGFWDARRGLQAFRTCAAPCRLLTWSSDGAYLAWLEGDYQGGHLWVWTAASGRSHALTAAQGGLAWSPDSTRLAYITSAGTLALWHPATGMTQTLAIETAIAPAWSPDSAQLAVALPGGTVGLLTPGRFLPELLLADEQPFAWIVALAWSPDGAHLALMQRRFFPPEHDHHADEPTDDRQGSETLGAQPWLVNLHDRTLTPLPRDPSAAFARPAWSADSRSLAVAWLPLGIPDPRPAVWVYDATTLTVTQRIPNAAAPAWASP